MKLPPPVPFSQSTFPAGNLLMILPLRRTGVGHIVRASSRLLLLKFQQFASFFTSITAGFVFLICTANRRIASPDTPTDSASSRLYQIIKVFFIVVLLLLLFVLVAYFNGWHFSVPFVRSSKMLGLLEFLYANGLDIRANYLAPPLPSLTNVCIVLFLIQSVDRIVLMVGCFWIKSQRMNLKSAMEYPSSDGNVNIEDYLFALVQILMCNERERNHDLALVQTRWAFVNKNENLLTRLQNINLSFHFEVEQQVNGVFLNFFGFNGTAGVCRIKALEECGGWLERTTVEDMDVAVRTHLRGWKFIYLNGVKCLCELPESYEAYKKQQHRLHSGPMQLFWLCLLDVLHSKA